MACQFRKTLPRAYVPRSRRECAQLNSSDAHGAIYRPVTGQGEHVGDVGGERNFVSVQEGSVVFLDIVLSAMPTVTRRADGSHAEARRGSRGGAEPIMAAEIALIRR